MDISPKEIVMYNSPEVLTIIIKGKHFRFYAKEYGKEELLSLSQLVREVKEFEEPEKIAELNAMLDKNYRAEDGPYLVRDFKGNRYLKETPHIKVAKPVLDMIDKCVETGMDVSSVINLWKNALDNPSEQAREDLMTYIERFGVPTTDNGYMILYKSVRRIEDIIHRIDYVVAKMFMNIRSNKQTDPKDYFLFNFKEVKEDWISVDFGGVEAEIGDFCITKKQKIAGKVKRYLSPEELEGKQNIYPDDDDFMEYSLEHVEGKKPKPFVIEDAELEPVGNLAQLFKEYVLHKDMDDLNPTDEDLEPLFAPFHRGDYGMRIRLGHMVTMPREECDPDINRDCSYGLHVGSYEYVSKFYQHESTVLAVLVNPRDIVALPAYDHSKIRCCAYLPYAIMKTDDEDGWEEVEHRPWKESYIDFEKAELENRIATLQAEIESGNALDNEVFEELIANAKNRLQSL